jgi:predicted NBD/HSP70 family sugar kinase
VKKILVIDIGGTNVKFVATGHDIARRFPSGRKLTPRRFVSEIKRCTADWEYECVSIGYPGVVRKNRVVLEPNNLGRGWVGFDFKSAFSRPVKVVNDAAMQALGSYHRGLMLFVGLGTGLGSALIADGVMIPMELGQLAYKRGTYEGYIGRRGVKSLGKKRWRRHVINVVKRFMTAVHPDDVVLGGGRAKKLGKLPKGCRLGDNAHAFTGGLRLWEDTERYRRKNKPKPFATRPARSIEWPSPRKNSYQSKLQPSHD